MTRGFSLIEMFVVFALVSIVAVSILTLSTGTRAELTRHTPYTQGVRGWHNAAREAYPRGYGSATASDLRALAPRTWVSGTNVIPPIGGTITPAAVTYLGKTGGGLQLTHANFPRVDCATIAMLLQPDYATFSINGTVVKANTAATFTRATADSACNAAANTLVGVTP